MKAILLNQQLIAGIGNLYADEILFRARMHPATEATRLSGDDLRRLFRATRYVLERAIALKTDFNRLPKSWLLTHRGKAGRCPRCGRALKSATIGGRTSWFCAHCQRLNLRALVKDRSKGLSVNIERVRPVLCPPLSAQHFQQCQCILRRRAFGVIVEVHCTSRFSCNQHFARVAHFLRAGLL